MTFQQGKSGNPNGRPKGSGSRQYLFNTLVAPHKEALFDKAIKLALEGNEPMLKLFLERMIPCKPSDEPININLPNDLQDIGVLLTLTDSIFRAIEQQNMTPEQGKKMLDILKVHRDNLIVHALNVKLNNIETKFKNLNDNCIGIRPPEEMKNLEEFI